MAPNDNTLQEWLHDIFGALEDIRDVLVDIRDGKMVLPGKDES